MTITWTSKSGKTITATPSEMMPATWIKVTVDGKVLMSGLLMPANDKRLVKVASQLGSMGMTHAIVCGSATIAVSPEIAAAIQAAQNDAANRPPTLASQRERLVCAIQAAGDEFSAAREAAFGEDTGRGWGRVHQAEASIKTTEQALADFDALHPEIAAAIEADRREAAERFLRAD